MQPAKRALDTGVKVDDRPHGAGGELLEGRVAVRTEPTLDVRYRIFDRPASRNAADRNTFPHLVPLWQVKLVGRFRIPLVRTHCDAPDALIRSCCRFGL